MPSDMLSNARIHKAGRDLACVGPDNCLWVAQSWNEMESKTGNRSGPSEFLGSRLGSADSRFSRIPENTGKGRSSDLLQERQRYEGNADTCLSETVECNQGWRCVRDKVG